MPSSSSSSSSTSLTSSFYRRLLLWLVLFHGQFGALRAQATVADEATTGVVDQGGGETEELHHDDEEGEEEEGTVSPSVTILVVILIVLTILFEQAKEAVVHSANKDTRPIIGSLFAEMTILGFLSLFTFCVTKMGVFPEISEAMFGDSEELLELFEFVHYMLFFIMVFFVITVLGLVRGAKQMERKWRKMEMACRDERYMEHVKSFSRSKGLLKELYNDRASFRSSTWITYLRTRFFCSSESCCGKCSGSNTSNSNSKSSVMDLLLYSGVRQEFILERSHDAPFAPASNRVDDDFNFARYLSINYGHVLSHVVEVNISTWIFFGACAVVYFFFLEYVTNEVWDLAWIMTFLGWVSLVVRNYFGFHISTILKAMSVPPFSDGSADFWSPCFKSKTLDEPEETGRVSPTDTRLSPSASTHSLSAENLISYDSIARSCRPQRFRQEDLYWRGRKGPHFYIILFQIKLVFMSAYISLLCLAFLPFMYRETHAIEFCLYFVASVVPIFFMMGKLRENVTNVAIVNSIGCHRHPQVVSQVIREEKTDRLILAIVVMEKLHHAALNGFHADQDSIAPAITYHDESQIHSIELDLAIKTFEALDKDGNGDIEAEEIQELLLALNIPATDEALSTMIKLLDTDNDGSISKHEFVDFYKKHIIPKMDGKDEDLEELAKKMFHLFDTDNSGDITLGEFKEIIDNFNVGFTVDEIGYLVSELDEDQSGTIGEHEFHNLLTKHSYLFGKQSLPPLE